jgi:hypothetical protein
MAYLDSKGEWRDDLLGYVLSGEVKGSSNPLEAEHGSFSFGLRSASSC